MKILPKKVYLDDALVYFDWTGLNKNQGYRALLQFNQEDGIPLYFDTVMDFCRKATDDHSIEYNGPPQGRGKRVMFSEPGVFDFNDDTPKLLLAAETRYDDDHFFIRVIKFFANGNEYFVVDSMAGCYAWGSPVIPTEFYFLREDISELIQKNKESSTPDIAPPVREKKPKLKVNDKRLLVFKSWLATAGKATSGDEPDYQQCYEKRVYADSCG